MDNKESKKCVVRLSKVIVVVSLFMYILYEILKEEKEKRREKRSKRRPRTNVLSTFIIVL